MRISSLWTSCAPRRTTSSSQKSQWGGRLWSRVSSPFNSFIQKVDRLRKWFFPRQGSQVPELPKELWGEVSEYADPNSRLDLRACSKGIFEQIPPSKEPRIPMQTSSVDLYKVNGRLPEIEKLKQHLEPENTEKGQITFSDVEFLKNSMSEKKKSVFKNQISLINQTRTVGLSPLKEAILALAIKFDNDSEQIIEYLNFQPDIHQKNNFVTSGNDEFSDPQLKKMNENVNRVRLNSLNPIALRRAVEPHRSGSPASVIRR